MADSKHATWEFKNDYHTGDKYGCIWRHSSSKWENTACDHKLNAFEASKSRDDMYAKDHRMNARILGFLDMYHNFTGKGASEILSRAYDKDKDDKWLKKYFKRYKTSISWLKKDPNAWHINHTVKGVSFKGKSNSNTFVPRPQGGPGAWFPYFHNAHHIIPQGAFKEYVIFPSGKVTPSQRRDIVLASKWNINNPDNMVILPQELQIATIAQLPAHCPYGSRSHPEYSKSLKSELKDTKKKIDKAVKTEKCEDVEEVKLELEKVSEKMLNEIKKMRPGTQVGK